MTSSERLLRVLRGEPLDRVPISTYELVGWNPDSWENAEPSYRRLMEAIRTKTDCLYMWDSGGVAVDPDLWRTETFTEPDGTEVTRRHLHAAGHVLRCEERRKGGVRTLWRTERLLKREKDVEVFLELPLVVLPPDGSELRKRREALGERGIMMHTVEDPLCITAELFSFRDFLFVFATEKALIHRLLAKVAPVVSAYVDSLLKSDFGPLFRIVGPEYATPPYLDRTAFEQFVVNYDRVLIEKIHRRGKYARLHCHGRIAKVLDLICELNPDALDPLEPPPDGDITLAEAKQRTGGRITLFGNLELKYLEHGTVEEVRRLTLRALREGMPGGRFVLMPTAAPIGVPLPRKTEENFLCFIQTALQYGRYR